MLPGIRRRADRFLGPQTAVFWAWASLISQILIVATGGLVRLTGSGLGCPTWPKCTTDSLVTVPAQGYHGLIEFGNRLLTFVLLNIAVAMWAVAVRKRGAARELGLLWPSIVLLAGVPAQAILGGFTVWSKLNPWFVGSHFILSGIMIVVATILVWRAHNPGVQVVPAFAYSLAPVIWVFGVVAVVVGVLVTGAGPHAGDAQSVRNGLDLAVWEHYHSYPAYSLLWLVFVQFLVLFRADRSEDGKRGRGLPARIARWLLVVLIAQAAIGVAQSRLGVPATLVEIHMLLASCLISLITFDYLATRAK